MKKRLVITTLVTIFLLLGAATVSSVNVTVKQANSKSTFADHVISLGTALAYGDGVEGNTIADAETEKSLIIQLNSNQETADLYMTYSIQCDGTLDNGSTYFFVQLNGISVGNLTVYTDESDSGTLEFKDVLLTRGDVLTYEIGVLYACFNPIFSKADLDIGATIIINKPKAIHNNLFRSPFFQFLQRSPIFARLFA